MDARAIVLSAALLLGMVSPTLAQFVPVAQPMAARRVVIETTHFRVFANDPQLAQEIAEMAEAYRRHLAMHWLEKELPPWLDKVPVTVQSAPNMPASGETKYTLVGGTVRNFQMLLCGSRERIIDSVLPHEMTHTILASHFAASGKPVPRWADEGACTTVEHASERGKHDTMLVRFLSEGRGIPFASLFAMREYPRDLMPLYAQGYSLCAFLIAQGGPRQFIKFLERGMQDEDWVSAVAQCYGYPKLGKLQLAWNQWVSDGGGAVADYSAVALGYTKSSVATLASNVSTNPETNVTEPNNRMASLGSRGGSFPFDPLKQPGPSMVANGAAKGYYQQQFQRHSSAQISPEKMAETASHPLLANAIAPPTSQPPAWPDTPGFSLPAGNGVVPTPGTVPGTPIIVGQPGPMQTMGGTLYR
jgi:hypothetical protein